MSTIALSVVSSCYDEAPNLPKLHAELTRVLGALGATYEIVLVDNGSTDGSWPLLVDLAARDPHVRVVRLTRNFTFQGGLAAGMAHARGAHLAILDADLQDPADVLVQLYRKAVGEGVDVVYGVRRARKEGLARRAGYAHFYRVRRALTPLEIPADAGDFAVISRRVLDLVLALPERERFLRGLRAWTGFRSVGVPYERAARAGGRSKFGYGELVSLALRSLFSFSFLPLRAFLALGAVLLGLVLPLSAGWLALRPPDPAAWPPGTSAVVLLLVAILGVLALGVGVLGEYVAILFVEAKGRPLFVVDTTLNLEPKEPS